MNNIKTLSNIRDSLNELIAQQESLKSPKSKRGKFKIIDGDIYYEYNSACYIFRSASSVSKINLYGHGCFRTKEDADLYRKITERAHDLIGDWRPNWENQSINKYSLCFNHITKEVEVHTSQIFEQKNTIYFPYKKRKTLLEEFTQQELRFWITGEWESDDNE